MAECPGLPGAEEIVTRFTSHESRLLDIFRDPVFHQRKSTSHSADYANERDILIGLSTSYQEPTSRRRQGRAPWEGKEEKALEKEEK